MSNRVPLVKGVVLALVVAAIIVHPAAADMLRTSVVNDVNDLGGPSPTRVERIGEALTGPLSDSMSTTVGDATGTSSVFVDYGYVNVTGSADVSAIGTPNFTRIANGSAQGRWVDEITIDAPGLTGQFFNVSFLMEFSGSLFASVIQPPGGASDIARWSAGLAWGNLPLISGTGEHREGYLSQHIVPSTFGVMESQQIPIRFGTPFSLTFTLNGSASAVSDLAVVQRIRTPTSAQVARFRRHCGC